MAKDSFEKCFIVKDKTSIQRIESALERPVIAKAKKRNYEFENARSIEILRKRLCKS